MAALTRTTKLVTKGKVSKEELIRWEEEILQSLVKGKKVVMRVFGKVVMIGCRVHDKNQPEEYEITLMESPNKRINYSARRAVTKK